jgi:hypothetical protein
LGLYHVHRGVEAAELQTASVCSSPCYEHQPELSTDMSSDTTGDLCSDTRPTPLNRNCSDPHESFRDCSGNPFVNTPFTFVELDSTF